MFNNKFLYNFKIEGVKLEPNLESNPKLLLLLLLLLLFKFNEKILIFLIRKKMRKIGADNSQKYQKKIELQKRLSKNQ